MSRFLAAFLFLLSLLPFFAVESNALKGNGIIDNTTWHAGTPSGVEFTSEGTVLIYGVPDVRSYVIQKNLVLLENTRYYFKVELRGTPNLKADFYVERNNAPHTELKTVSVGEEWQESVLEFKARPGGTTKYYAVLSVQAGQDGHVEFRNPSIEVIPGELVNGDFSNGDAVWELENAVIVDRSNSDGLCVKLEGIDGRAAIRQGGLNVRAGRIYRLSYDVKGGTDLRYADIQGATWSRIAVLDDQGQVIPGTEVWRDCFGTTWQHKEATFVAERDMKVSLLGELKEPGEVFFDNIDFGESVSMTPLLEIVLNPPFAYHNGVVAGGDATTFDGVVYPLINSAFIEVEFGGARRSFPGNAPAAFSFDIPGELGTTAIQARLVDGDGDKVADASLDFTVRPEPPRSFYFDKDRVFHIDGKPVFPILSWRNLGDMPFEESTKKHAEMGFNMLMTQPPLLDIIADYGLMGMVAIPAPFFAEEGGFDPESQAIQGIIEEYKHALNHPALAAWYVVDEPAWRGEPASRSVNGYNRLLKYIDDSRPAFLNEAPRGTINEIRPYAHAADIYGVDIYPIPAPNSHSGLEDKMMTSVGKYTDICREVVHDSKPIWMTLQGFSWGAWNKTPVKVYPTRDESRYMAYEAIAHGATGLAYWGLIMGTGQNDEFLDGLSDTIHEVLSLSAILIAPASEGTVATSNANLLACHKGNASGDVWILLNESGESFTADITGSFPETLRVIGEGRTVATSGGSFSDSFAPYGVHVYVDASRELPEPLGMPAMRRLSEKKASIPKSYEDAKWIWYPGLSKTDDAQAVFRIPVHIDGPVESAILSVTADDGFACSVNGREVMRRNDFLILWTLDIAEYLKPGENEIVVHAADLGGAPCGAIFSLTLSDGQVILSDGSIQAAQPGSGDWVDAEEINAFGARPWGALTPYHYNGPTRQILPIPSLDK